MAGLSEGTTSTTIIKYKQNSVKRKSIHDFIEVLFYIFSLNDMFRL